MDSKCFWIFTFAFPIVWYLLLDSIEFIQILIHRTVFAFFSLLRMNVFWIGVNAVAIGLSGLNAYLYLQASKSIHLVIFFIFVETSDQVNLLNYIPGNVREKAMK